MTSFIVLVFLNLLVCFTSIKTTTNKFCINCKFFTSEKKSSDKYGKCLLFPINDNYFLVNNEQNVNYDFCVTARSFDHMCGEKAKHYVRRYNKKNTTNLDTTNYFRFFR
jgi:hypothetical protein